VSCLPIPVGGRGVNFGPTRSGVGPPAMLVLMLAIILVSRLLLRCAYRLFPRAAMLDCRNDWDADAKFVRQFPLWKADASERANHRHSHWFVDLEGWKLEFPPSVSGVAGLCHAKDFISAAPISLARRVWRARAAARLHAGGALVLSSHRAPCASGCARMRGGHPSLPDRASRVCAPSP
jgi:hypothetical protein